MNNQVRSFSDLKATDSFKVELAKQEFALEIRRAMILKDISNAVLAEKLGVSRPMVTKLLRGDSNVTIETMVKAAIAVGGQLFLKIILEGTSARFFEVAHAISHKQIDAAQPVAAMRQAGHEAVWNFAANEEDHENESLAA